MVSQGSRGLPRASPRRMYYVAAPRRARGSIVRTMTDSCCPLQTSAAPRLPRRQTYYGPCLGGPEVTPRARPLSLRTMRPRVPWPPRPRSGSARPLSPEAMKNGFKCSAFRLSATPAPWLGRLVCAPAHGPSVPWNKNGGAPRRRDGSPVRAFLFMGFGVRGGVLPFVVAVYRRVVEVSFYLDRPPLGLIPAALAALPRPLAARV